MKKESWIKSGVQVDVLYSRAAVATQILVRGGGSSLLADAGDGTLRDLLDLGLEPSSLAAICLTHGHYDHIGGLWGLLGHARMKGRTESLPVFAPRGSSEAMGLAGCFAGVHAGKFVFPVEFCELDSGDEFSVGPFRILSLSVPHWSFDRDGSCVAMPALGYRLTLGPISVAVTGDCGDSQSVRELVSGADLALVEASFTSYASESEKKVHLTERLAREIGALAREHILVHRQV